MKAVSEKGLKEILPVVPFINQDLIDGYVKETVGI
jgi:hypothetical protein